MGARNPSKLMVAILQLQYGRMKPGSNGYKPQVLTQSIATNTIKYPGFHETREPEVLDVSIPGLILFLFSCFSFGGLRFDPLHTVLLMSGVSGHTR